MPRRFRTSVIWLALMLAAPAFAMAEAAAQAGPPSPVADESDAVVTDETTANAQDQSPVQPTEEVTTEASPTAQPPAAQPSTEQAPAEEAPADAQPPGETPGDQFVPSQPAFLMNVAVNRADARYSHGERLWLRCKSERDAHVYVLYHQADGRTVMIFPNVAQRDNRVAAGAEVSIPAVGDEFRFRVGPPYGEEAMQVIAAEAPIELLEQLDAGAGRAAPVPKATLEELARLLHDPAVRFAEHRVVIHTQPGGGPLPEARPARRFALCIGVDKLQDESFGESTPIARNSAELMFKSLTTEGGVAPEQARLLAGEQATSSGVEQALTNWLPSVSQPGDAIFIFYCGHGGQIPALDDSEPDGLDELLSTYDMTKENPRETSITDDRLARWLQELPGRQLVLLLETCHGGGVVDGRGMTLSLKDEARRLHDVSGLNTIVVCACLPDEFSHFSAKLTAAYMPILFDQAMRELPKPLSVQAAFNFYREKLPEMLTDENLGAGVPGYAQEPSLTDRALLPVILAPADAAPHSTAN